MSLFALINPNYPKKPSNYRQYSFLSKKYTNCNNKTLKTQTNKYNLYRCISPHPPSNTEKDSPLIHDKDLLPKNKCLKSVHKKHTQFLFSFHQPSGYCLENIYIQFILFLRFFCNIHIEKKLYNFNSERDNHRIIYGARSLERTRNKKIPTG